MYSINVPLITNLKNEDYPFFVTLCKQAKIDKIFLPFNLVLADDVTLKNNLSVLKNKIKLFKTYDIDVSVWLYPTLGYGGNNGVYVGEKAKKFIHKRILNVKGGIYSDPSIKSKYIHTAFCPLDARFVEKFCKCINGIASLDIDLIMLEDDLSLSSVDMREMSCCCPLHLKEYRKRINENIKAEDLFDKIYKNEDLKYRFEWYKLKKDTMLNFMSKIRNSINKTNPLMRVGLCANRSSFELDGATIQEMAKTVAGETKPFVRLTGAPYWEEAQLQSIIETVRLQSNWINDPTIEVLSEGDTYPRPRYRVSANKLEMFDMILRADNCANGILKYMFEYNSNLYYELGYINKHIENQNIYTTIDKVFGDKQTIGVNVFEKQNLILQTRYNSDNDAIENAPYLIFDTVAPTSQVMMKDNSIPTCYNRNDYGNIVFGENARYVTEKQLKSGMVLDFIAAKILHEKGIDVGFIGYTKTFKPNREYFITENDYSIVESPNTDHFGNFYAFTLNKDAIIKSEFQNKDNTFTLSKTQGVLGCPFPACYIYQNKDGYRFAVYAFSASSVHMRKQLPFVTGLFKNYYRQKQLVECIEFVQNKKLPAMCSKHPDLYILCKKNEDSMAIGLWNIFDDEINNAQIILDRDYNEATFYYTSGSLNKNKITLNEKINAYGFAFILIK